MARGSTGVMPAVLHALTLCAGGMVTDRMLEAVAGCTPNTIRAAACYLRKKGHRTERVSHLGYRLVQQ